MGLLLLWVWMGASLYDWPPPRWLRPGAVVGVAAVLDERLRPGDERPPRFEVVLGQRRRKAGDVAIELLLDRVRPAPRVTAQLRLHLVDVREPGCRAGPLLAPCARGHVDLVALRGVRDRRLVVEVLAQPGVRDDRVGELPAV